MMETPKFRKKNRDLVKLRRKVGYTQMDVGILTKGVVNYTKMSHFENGYLLPTEDEVKVMAEVLKVSQQEIKNTFK